MTLSFSEYQQAAARTAIYPKRYAIEYLSLGLASEAGEVSGKVKKVLRDQGGVYNPENIDAIKGEAADCLWYLAQLANELGFDLGEAAAENITKLQDRQQRGALGGSGDKR